MNSDKKKLSEPNVFLPQRPYQPTTLFDMFFDVLKQHSTSIELPDFIIPQIDIHESSSLITLEIELPGMKPEDFHYKIDGDLIHIKGEKRKSTVLSSGVYTRTERRYGLFARTLRLPAEIIDNQASTIYENGVLKITLRKKQVMEVNCR